MSPDHGPISEEAARAIWRRAAQLQAEAERRMEERALRLPPVGGTNVPIGEGVRLDDVRAAAEEAGIPPEFVQIALAEATAAGTPAESMGGADIVGSKLFLAASQRTIEASATVKGSVDTVAAAVLQVFSGHPCLLQAGEVAELPTSAGRVIVFNVPKYDWSASANPPFVEKAWTIGLRQLYVAVRPLPEDPTSCEVVVAGDLHAGMRTRWRLSAATSVGATAAGAAAGVSMAASVLTGALLALPAVAGAAALSGATVAMWSLGYATTGSRWKNRSPTACACSRRPSGRSRRAAVRRSHAGFRAHLPIGLELRGRASGAVGSSSSKRKMRWSCPPGGDTRSLPECR